jgi:hypothetical protein
MAENFKRLSVIGGFPHSGVMNSDMEGNKSTFFSIAFQQTFDSGA